MSMSGSIKVYVSIYNRLTACMLRTFVTLESSLILFWVAAIVVVVLRTLSSTVRGLSSYGGRRIDAGECVFSATRSPATWLSHLTTTVSRKRAFQCFYLSGIATCVAAVAFSTRAYFQFGDAQVGAVGIFGVHCAVRWYETTWRQKFRNGDIVTVFACISGSVFYVVAALSAACWREGALRQQQPVDESLRDDLLQQSVVIAALLASHIFLQVVQVWHHEILRSLRTRPCSEKSARYVFPKRRGLFRWVQEPHYLMEVLMYAVQWAYLREVVVDRSYWSPLLPSLLAGLFTLLNLSVTATGHRRYWLTTQFAKQLPVWKVIPGVV